MRAVLALSIAVVTLAGCVAPPAPVAPPRVVVAPPPVPVVAPVPPPLAADWNDWPFTPGDWRYLQQPGATVGRFETAGQAALTLICDRFTRLVRLTGIAPAPATIRTTSLTRVVAPGTGEPALVFAANDPLLDAIAFSRGRFVVEQAGRAPLVLRPYAEIGRVIEDCRG
ncbi:MAG: hypothetical protein J0I47_08165 [Sphingomonas sp.]|uniref:hypothetical protein n=1 Tax=Sphingomonas sp. TaxID=28214 RepID=UPI001ACCA81A|nr:hypothetical protein [Sphingomonas sp.]MBN8808197.1 hypothetical protein [Sphingomonas sp.]